MHILRLVIIILALFVPLSVFAEAKLTIPGELRSEGRDRANYDLALKQLDASMRRQEKVPSYEDMVDLFAQYRDKISTQEIGGTLYSIYSQAGPKPAKKYYAQRKIDADNAAALAAAQKKAEERVALAAKAQQEAAAAKAKAQAAAQVKPPVKTYTNSAGNTVQSPTHSASKPAGASAQCRDGSYSFSQNRRGTCSGHGGVAVWY